jgi:hypothetical protein
MQAYFVLEQTRKDYCLKLEQAQAQGQSVTMERMGCKH